MGEKIPSKTEALQSLSGDRRSFIRRAGLAATSLATGLGASSVTVSADETGKEALVETVTDTETFEAMEELLEDEHEVEPETDEASVVRRKYDNSGVGLSIPLVGGDDDTPETTLNAAVEHDTVRLATEVDETIHLASQETLSDFENGVYSVGLVDQQTYREQTPEGTATTDQIGTQSHALPYIGFAYNYQGTYDDDYVCDNFESAGALIGALAFLVGNDITGVGVLDDYLIPFVVGAGAGCLAEQFVEDVVGGTLNCNNFLYEVYVAKWWVPIPQKLVVIPTC